MSLDWIINYFQCQSLLDEENIPRSFTEVEVQQYYLSGGTNMLGLSFFSHIHTHLPIPISNFRFLKRKRCYRKMILKRFISLFIQILWDSLRYLLCASQASTFSLCTDHTRKTNVEKYYQDQETKNNSSH